MSNIEQDVYVLLTKHINIQGGTDTLWEIYSDLEEARVALNHMKQESEVIERMSSPVHMGPILVQSAILKVKEIV